MKTKTLNIASVRKIIKSVDSRLDIAKGDGYFYFFSDHEELSLKLATIETTSVYVFSANDLSKDAWENEAVSIIGKINSLND